LLPLRSVAILQKRSDYLLLEEYFHGDAEAALGPSHDMREDDHTFAAIRDVARDCVVRLFMISASSCVASCSLGAISC
jgi:hypothetical protein